MKEDFDPIWVAPDVSPEIAQFIQSARLIMLTMNDGEVIKRAIASGQTLAQGASACIAQTINLVESKLGELSPDDENVVAVHLAGTIVDYAAQEGDHDAKNKKRAVEAITDAAMVTLQAEQGPMAPQGAPVGPMGAARFLAVQYGEPSRPEPGQCCPADRRADLREGRQALEGRRRTIRVERQWLV